jgi:2-dehydro-3-deoxy-D-arabinonate dehydratase
MHRRFKDLVTYVFRADRHPSGVVLSTGTGIVPDMDFSLRADDEVVISIEGIGELVNTVRVGSEAFDWLVDRHDELERQS